MDLERIEREYRREMRRCDIQEAIGYVFMTVGAVIAAASLFVGLR